MLKDLSPFLIILKSIYKKHPDNIQSYLKNKKAKFVLFIPPELDINQEKSPVAVIAPGEGLAQKSVSSDKTTAKYEEGPVKHPPTQPA
jgi:hypothetical protein